MEQSGREVGKGLTLDDGVDDPLLLRAASPGSQVTGNGLVDLDEAGFFIDDVELVLVNQLVAASAQFPDGLVVLIHDSDVAMAVAVAGVVVTFKAEQDIFALPASGLEVGRPNAVDAVAGPDQVSVVAEDVRAGLARAVLLGGGVGVTGKGGHKEVPLFDILGRRDGDVQPRRRKVGPGAELPVGSGRSEQQISCQHRGDGPHGHGGATRGIELGASATAESILFNDRYIHLWVVYAPELKLLVPPRFPQLE